MNQPLKPLDKANRILLLDVMRGFALFGIMFVNMTWFTGFAVLSSSEKANLATEQADKIVYWLIQVLVDGKFWTMFAFLFGVGVAIQVQRTQRTGVSFAKLYSRRIGFLFLIGMIHATVLWFGDIVSLYAITGFILLVFHHRSDRCLLIFSVALLLSPIFQLLIGLGLHHWLADTGAGDPGYGPIHLLPCFGGGSWTETLIANLAFLKERWIIAVYDGRFLKLAGMFLLGMWAGRKNLFGDPDRHRFLLKRILAVGVFVGLSLNIVAYTSFSGVSLRPPTVTGWILESIKTIAIPLLSLAYMAGVALLYSTISRIRKSRLAGWLATVGRMSLTNYVMQSVLGVVFFYGYGFGLWGQFGVTWSVAFILVAFGFQILFSAMWLRFFRHGPLEWLWRSLTYGTWLPIRMAPNLEIPKEKSSVTG